LFQIKLKASYTVSDVLWTLTQEKFNPQTIHNSSEASPKFSERPNILTLSEH